MASTVIILLIVFWFLGFIRVPGIYIRDFTVFRFGAKAVTLWEILVLILILWAVEVLPTPLREIGYVAIVLWVLSVLGIIAISGLSHLIIAAAVIGLILSLFNKK